MKRCTTGQESMSLIASLPSANWMSGTGLERGLTEFWRICWRKLNGHRMCNICTYFIITDSRISCFSATFVLIKHQQQQQEAGREGSRGSPATGFCESICMYLHVVELCRWVAATCGDQGTMLGAKTWSIETRRRRHCYCRISYQRRPKKMRATRPYLDLNLSFGMGFR